MNEETKTITAEEFAPILHKAFIRYAVCIPGTYLYDKDLLASLGATLRNKVDKRIYITNSSILTENMIQEVIKCYCQKAASWYNILRKLAWDSAAKEAFHREYTTPEYLPISLLSQEFNVRKYGKRVGTKEFYVLAHRVHADDSLVVHPDGLVKMIQFAEHKGKDCMHVLWDMYKVHFEINGPQDEPQVVEVKDLKPEIRVEMHEQKEAAVQGETLVLTNKIIASIVAQLKAIHDSKIVAFDKDDVRSILESIGMKDMPELYADACYKIRDLKDKVKELESQLADSQSTKAKIMKILNGDVAA